jgi:hypothetical protein
LPTNIANVNKPLKKEIGDRIHNTGGVKIHHVFPPFSALRKNKKMEK